MNDPSSSAPRSSLTTFALPSVLLVIASSLGYLAYRPPLQTPRPLELADNPLPDPPSSAEHFIHAVFARMWEDPLSPSHRHQRSRWTPPLRTSAPYAKIVQDTKERKTGNKKLLFMPVLVPGSPSGEDLETRKRTRYAILAGLESRGYVIRLNKRMSYVRIPIQRTFEVTDGAPRGSRIPLLIPTKLYHLEDDRSRCNQYSSILVAWINQDQLGDRPLEAISQIYKKLFVEDGAREKETREDVSVAIMGPRGSDALATMLRDDNVVWKNVPYNASRSPAKREALRGDNQRSKSGLRFYLEMPNIIETGLVSTRSQMRDQAEPLIISGDFPFRWVRIFRSPLPDSPASFPVFPFQVGLPTERLGRMHLELTLRLQGETDRSPQRYAFPASTTVYSSTSTATFQSLLSAPCPSDTGSSSNQRSDPCRTADQNDQSVRGDATDDRPKIRLVRCIGDDQQLIRLIWEELSLRGVRLPDQQDSEDRGFFSPIVLITERDTLYGRSIRSLFEDELAKTNQGRRRVRIYAYSYLRGADGKLIHPPTDDGFDNRGSTKSEVVAGRELPRGPAQLDYLRRLESQLLLENQRRIRNGHGEIRAIGVVGTDFYDKLLVLRALRKSFPRAWFFTTDLDAGFLHPAEFHHSRNLLVASHFGLNLHGRRQRGTPPFRDSYQTATFFATMLAVLDCPTRQGKMRDEPCKMCDEFGSLDRNDPWGLGSDEGERPTPLRPLMFEIGRHRAYQLTRTGDKQDAVSAVHPRSPREESPSFWGPRGGVIWLLVSLLFLLCLGNFDRNTRSVLSFLFIAPFARFSAVAPWAHKFFCWIGVSDPGAVPAGQQEGAESEGTRRYKLGVTVAAWITDILLISIGVLIWIDHSSESGEPFSLTDGISVWPSVLLRLLVVLLGIRALRILWEKLAPDQTELERFFPDAKIDESARKRIGWIERLLVWMWRCEENGSSAAGTGDTSGGTAARISSPRELFQEYQILGKWKLRVFRVVLVTFIYLVFGWQLFRLFGRPNAPFRGLVSEWLTFGVTISSIVVMVAMLMLMLDAVQVARRFIRELGKDSYKEWGIEKNEHPKLHPWKSLDTEEIGAWLAIRVTGELTKMVGNAIWWPVVLVLLVVVSRFPYFDGWDISWTLVTLILINLIAVIFCGLSLRRTAQEARREVLEFLEWELIRRERERRATKQLERMIADIQATDAGAFRPLSQDPFLWALTVPFGGAGGLLFLERLLNLYR